ncbi:sigma-54 interaction domain-containing protein [Pokkaliibacter sp. CJK22405]|uniref:sigma-54 interaction domain-containing protein n=1 Tax=Pokkaliibacter sp. CJK22405 TaxID=3384615 RepID=UPI003984F79E
MNKPVIWLVIPDPALETTVRNLPVLSSFVVESIRLDSSDWVSRIESQTPSTILIQADRVQDQYLEQILEYRAQIEIMMMSDGTPNPLIDSAMRQGASFHFRLPLEENLLTDILTDIVNEVQASDPAVASIRSDLDQFGLLLGSSDTMRRVYRMIRKVADTDASVMIIGESGCGKELVANTLHLMSSRINNPFIAINSSAFSSELIESELFGHEKGAFTGAHKSYRGIFEQAHEGTLFLDEVTEMPIELQAKLLRVLETGSFSRLGSEEVLQTDVRVIAATNRSPEEAIANGRLREDLYFRLAQFPIELPPLRTRGEDILGLAKHFLAYRNASDKTQKFFSNEAIYSIENYSWPGNVRELKHLIERAHILAHDEITLEHLGIEPDYTPAAERPDNALVIPADAGLEEMERQVILQTLERFEGNKTRAAEQLGISIKTLYNKLEKYRS